MLCAALALGLVFWLRPDGKKKGGVAAEGNSSRVTKPYPRERDARERRTKNPREEFEAARKRGLTEEEVRWVVEDFLELGIDSDDISADTLEGHYQLRMKRQAWLLNAMVSGFGLSDEQRKQAAARLQELGEMDYKTLKGDFADSMTIEVEGKAIQIIGGWDLWIMRKLSDADQWLAGDKYLPWNLCDFDEAQKAMVPLKMENGELVWPHPGSVTHDIGTEQRYENLDGPFTNQNAFITPSGSIISLSMDQVDRIWSANVIHVDHVNQGGRAVGIEPRITLVGRLGILPYAKLLSGPQLRTYLLFRPDMAEHLLKELGE